VSVYAVTNVEESMWLFNLWHQYRDVDNGWQRLADLPLWNILRLDESSSLNIRASSKSGSASGCRVSRGHWLCQQSPDARANARYNRTRRWEWRTLTQSTGVGSGRRL